jgi:YVTN family beta-propeller protein
MRSSPAVRRTAWFLAGLLVALACDNSSGPGITLDVTPDSIQLVRNDSVRLSVAAVNGDGQLVTGVAVTFESADTTIVTVTNLGLVRARVKLGQTTVRVSGGGAQRTIPVIVYVPPAFIVVGPSDTLITRGATVQMHASVFDANSLPITGVTPTWESTAPAMVSVSATGLARGDSAGGEAFIVARVGGVSGVGRVRVRGPTTIVVIPQDTTVDPGDTVRFQARVYDQLGDSIPGATVVWGTNNPGLVTMTSAGTARPIADHSGIASITARSGPASGSAQLTVRDKTILGNRVAIAGSPSAAAISVNGVAYVVAQGSQLWRADLPSQTFAPGGATLGSDPNEVAFNSTGTRAYVTNQSSSNVSVVDVSTNSTIDVIPVGNRPFEVIVEPGDSILWTGKIDSLYGIRLATKEIIARFYIGHVGNGIAIVRDTLLYVSTHQTGTVVEVNLKTRTLHRTFSVGGVPQKLALSADENTLYIANEAGYVQFWNLVSGLQDGTNIALPGGAGYGIARRPTTGKLYVTTAYFGGGAIYILDPDTRVITNGVVTNGSTREVVFDSSGLGFVPNENGWVDFIK